jgi:hypothetical protein
MVNVPLGKVTVASLSYNGAVFEVKKEIRGNFC